MNCANLLLVIILSVFATAMVVPPTDGVFPFHETETIASGVTYAPLIVSVDLFKIRNLAKNFYNTSVYAARK